VNHESTGLSLNFAAGGQCLPISAATNRLELSFAGLPESGYDVERSTNLI